MGFFILGHDSRKVPGEDGYQIKQTTQRFDDDGKEIPEAFPPPIPQVVPSGDHIELAHGILTWDGQERRSNSYSKVALEPTNYHGDAREGFGKDDHALAAWDGQPGTLVAEVVRTRKSGHCGDLSRNIFPTTPAVGDRIVLGTGHLMVLPDPGATLGVGIGLRPTPYRPYDWLDPTALYRVHDQTIRLLFIPA